MRHWLEKIRGAVGIGLAWAGLWCGVGALAVVLPGAMTAPYRIPLEWLVGFAAQFAAQFAVLGFVGGATFSLFVGATEGRRSFDQLSVPRFAVWGAFGGLVMWAVRAPIGESVMKLLGSLGMPGPVGVYGISGGLIVLLAAGSAAGTLALAQRVDGPQALEADDGMADVALTGKGPAVLQAFRGTLR